MIGDHLTADVRAAHGRMLDAYDRLMSGVLRREGPAMIAQLRRDGMTDTEAAAGALAHVARLTVAIQVARARHEAMAAPHRH